MLRDWLENRGIRHNAFASSLGLSAGYLSDLLSGAKKPSLPLALRIDQETGGAVCPRSWYSAAELAGRFVANVKPQGAENDHAAKDAPALHEAQGNEVAS